MLPRESAASAEMNGLAVTASRTAWADLNVLCLTAMRKDPLRRYQSVEALIRDVDHYLKGEPLEARPDTWHYSSGQVRSPKLAGGFRGRRCVCDGGGPGDLLHREVDEGAQRCRGSSGANATHSAIHAESVSGRRPIRRAGG